MKLKEHWPEYLCELAGTAIMVFIGLSAIAIDFGDGAPVAGRVASANLRLFLTGLVFAGGGTAVTYSFLGKRSGAHINPAMTFLFWLSKKTTTADFLAYVAAQTAGATIAAFAAKALWGPWALSTRLGVTGPGNGISWPAAFGAEVVMTAMLGLLILFMLARPALMRWTGVAAGALVVGLVYFGAAISGTSLNPARSFGPAAVLPSLSFLWIYLTAPFIGAALALAAFRLASGRNVICAKIFHTFDVRCIFCAFHPAAASAPADPR